LHHLGVRSFSYFFQFAQCRIIIQNAFRKYFFKKR
jgi:hypothetical protein